MNKIKTYSPTKEKILNDWERCFAKNKQNIPNRPGVYILATSEAFLYIGCSLDIRQRVTQLADHPICDLALVHLRPKGVTRFDYIAEKLNLLVYWKLFAERAKRYQIEAMLIKKFKPVANDSKALSAFYLNSFK